MITLKHLTQTLDNYFGKELIQKARKHDPYLANGLQLTGKQEIKKIILGTSATAEFLEESAKAGADSIIVHHSLPLFHAYKLISPYLYKRLKVLIGSEISLFGYHYILDSHPLIGNNAQLIKKLGAKKLDPFFDEWGWTAEFEKPIKRQVLAERLGEIVSHDVFVVNGDSDNIKKFGMVSGGGVPKEKELQEIIDADLDLYITGEIHESTVGIFQELGVNYFAAGHYATEVFGVQELGLVLKDRFKDQVGIEFLDIPNPI